MPFNSLTTKFFVGNKLDKLLQSMFVHIKTQVENSQISESGFTIDQIMHLHNNFHKLVLARGNSI